MYVYISILNEEVSIDGNQAQSINHIHIYNA